MSYKRIDHFNGIVDYLAATHSHSATIPDDCIIAINAKMIELSIKPDTLSCNILADILRSLGLYKYLEDVPYVMQKLGGPPPPIFSRELRERLQTMFQSVTFQNMNYNYILIKLLQIQNENSLMNYVPLQKHDQKLAAHDEMWRDICTTNNWPFYGTDQR